MTKLHVGASVTIGDVELIPVETSYVRLDWTAAGLVGFAAKDVKAIVIRSDGHLRAVNLEGTEVSLDDLLDQVPELRERTGPRQEGSARSR
jgi:hypothetical protein